MNQQLRWFVALCSEQLADERDFNSSSFRGLTASTDQAVKPMLLPTGVAQETKKAA